MSNDFTTKVFRKDENPQKQDAGHFVNLLIDGNFKLIMSKPQNRQILIDLLNEFLPLRITSLELMMQEKRGRRRDLKSSVFDLDCELPDKRRVIVEVQFGSRSDYLDRMLYYSTWPISEQLPTATNYYRLKDVFIVSFCNFALVHDDNWPPDRLISSYTIREDSNGEIMTGALHFIYIELGRFNKGEDELKDQRDSFLFYLKNLGHLTRMPDNVPYEPVSKLLRAAEVESLAPDERNIYDHNMRNEFDIKSEIYLAKEEARAEGKAEGRAESQKEIAKAMLQDGLPKETVAKYSGLTLAEISAL